MRIRAVLTDLDGTLLEPDGSLSPEAREALRELSQRGVPVVPLTSKTRRELADWLGVHDCGRYGSFENGAGVVTPGGVEIAKGALPVAALRTALARARSDAGRLVSVDDLSDSELSELTGLPPERLADLRAREYDLPFLAPDVPRDELARLVAGLAEDVVLVAGGRFWHLMGRHGKREAAERLLELLPGEGAVLGLGDAPNDDFLDLADVAIVVPRPTGADPELLRLAPNARVAVAPAGRGWAQAVESVLRA
ncbi:MAG TPA: HAD-IIB family hydrolase [Thermoanaerobaculia bacterium]|nr:HAD-IIB family hydrolase [Thermoanaerobaculia bacterium]